MNNRPHQKSLGARIFMARDHEAFVHQSPPTRPPSLRSAATLPRWGRDGAGSSRGAYRRGTTLPLAPIPPPQGEGGRAKRGRVGAAWRALITYEHARRAPASLRLDAGGLHDALELVGLALDLRRERLRLHAASVGAAGRELLLHVGHLQDGGELGVELVADRL